MDPQETKSVSISIFHSAHNLMVGIGRVNVLMLKISTLEFLMLEILMLEMLMLEIV